jgi:hypothetical protein
MIQWGHSSKPLIKMSFQEKPKQRSNAAQPSGPRRGTKAHIKLFG